ncbi:MAG TPA: DUF6660 family protein [Cyclobacteriaceae bacterium]|nr:DUF6660 family protein [Cyclobacteriaceae bacterium]
MKTIRLIAAIYIFLLSVCPCTDRETCADEEKGFVTFSDDTGHHHTANELDYCSPFCICSCCSTHAQPTYSTNISNSNPLHNTQVNTLYVERPLFHNAKAIWQPPKIS